MLSLTAVLASLPPASLAETDLARFVAQTLGRRNRSELPGLASLFHEEALRGYPPGLGAVLASVCETLVADSLDPQLLDARSCDALLGSRTFIGRLESRVEVRRQRLRPGTLVTGELRQTLGMRLLILPGVGRELMLVAPVDLAQVPDARFSMPLGVVVVRPGTSEEAEVLRTSWAAIEESFGLSGPEAERWEARFFAIARRENHDARMVRDGLTVLSVESRRKLWEALVGHLRDHELPEQHRPGRRGLEARLANIGLELDRPWVEPTLALTESVYRAAGLDPDVMAGRCPCPREDLIRWGGWVDVPAAQRKRLTELEPTQIEHLLLALAEEEAGRADGLVETNLKRPLSSLRDGCLRPRWQRSRAALSGVDPLVLAENRIASGDDRESIKEKLVALAESARTQMAASRDADRVSLGRPSESNTKRRGKRTAEFGRGEGLAEVSSEIPGLDDSNPAAHPDDLDQASEPEALDPAEAHEVPAPPTPQLQDDTTDGTPRADPTRDPGRTAGSPTVMAPRFNLPPMPDVPPPRPAPRVRPRTDFPPMPTIPPAGALPTLATLAARAPSARAPSMRQVPQRLPSAASAVAPQSARSTPDQAAIRARPASERLNNEPRTTTSQAPARPPQARPPTNTTGTTHTNLGPNPSPRPATSAGPSRDPSASRVRLQTTPHLVTPRQGNEFYDVAFRELELLERDLLQRGPFAHAQERVDAIGREARELHDALGPSARSGDREFQAAQKRIEKVLEYLVRLTPLLDDSAPRPSSANEGSGFWSRLFKKKP